MPVFSGGGDNPSERLNPQRGPGQGARLVRKHGLRFRRVRNSAGTSRRYPITRGKESATTVGEDHDEGGVPASQPAEGERRRSGSAGYGAGAQASLVH